MRHFPSIFFLTGSAIFALATVAGAAWADCPGVTQADMNQCAAADYRKADAELTRAYRKLEKTPELRAAERAWIAYRDADCAYEAANDRGGSIAPMVTSMCLTARTRERIAVLAAGS